MAPSRPRRGLEETRYLISVLSSDTGCTLGEKFMSTLVYGEPLPRDDRPYAASLRILPPVKDACFALDVFGETLDTYSVQQSEGFVLLFDLRSEQSFANMAIKLWDISMAKQEQRRKGEHVATPTPFCIIGYNSDGLSARTVNKDHVRALVRNTQALYCEINDWTERTVLSIALKHARQIQQANGLPVRPERKLAGWRRVEEQLKIWLRTAVESVRKG